MIAECCVCGKDIELTDEEILDVDTLEDLENNFICDGCAAAALIFISETFKCREN